MEDLIPAQRVVACYHTFSGYCPGCRKRIESRAQEQPPAPAGVDLPQGQLGLGVLATAALLRVRLAARLRRHTGELTRFLWHDQVPPTNNAAERAMRPAVVARKISGGSRSQRGANATAILLSVLRTATQQHRPLLETLTTLLPASWAGANPGLLVDSFANTPGKEPGR